MKRIRAFDCARGFTVLAIPAIHAGMLFSKPYVAGSWLGLPLVAIAEGPGGQLFMFLMGFFFAFQQKPAWGTAVSRAIRFAGAGILLNAAKYAIPYVLGGLPVTVQSALGVGGDPQAGWHLLVLGDVLLFAAIAILVLQVVHTHAQAGWLALVLGLLVLVFTPLSISATDQSMTSSYGWQLLNGEPPRVFFPVFPWIVYPLFGLVAGYGWRQRKALFWKGMLGAGVLFLAVGGIGYFGVQAGWWESAWMQSPFGFYRTPFFSTSFHLAIVLLTLCVWQWIDQRVRETLLVQLLIWSSRHITLIYLVQWCLIAWLLPWIAFQSLGIWSSCWLMIYCTGLSYGISFAILQFTRHDHFRRTNH